MYSGQDVIDVLTVCMGRPLTVRLMVIASLPAAGNSSPALHGGSGGDVVSHEAREDWGGVVDDRHLDPAAAPASKLNATTKASRREHGHRADRLVSAETRRLRHRRSGAPAPG